MLQDVLIVEQLTENDFRDDLVLQIIEEYGRHQQISTGIGRPYRSKCRVRHGSVLSSRKRRCQYCVLTGREVRLTQRKCNDCSFGPALCQTGERDCHALWHSATFDRVRDLWFAKMNRKSPTPPAHTPQLESVRKCGHPKGAKNKRK